MRQIGFSFYVLIVIISFNISNAEADEKLISREVTTTGETKEIAIINGLIEAVRQIKGINVDVERMLKTSFEESISTENGKEVEKTDGSSVVGQNILSKTQGYIKSYEILSSVKLPDNPGWEVTLFVSIPEYKTPGFPPNDRRKIAIMPFRNVHQQYHFSGALIPAVDISHQFAHKLVSEFTQTRRFSVMDREYMYEYAEEKKLILSPDASVSELTKIGEVLGVDYLIVGTITEAGLTRQSHEIQVSGETSYDFIASFIVDYRIMVMATRQIKWANTITVSLGNSELKELVSDLEEGKMHQAVLGVAAKKIVNNSMNNIYPIRVVNIEPDGSVILNQGGISLSVRELFDIFSIGEDAIDPYTGESLGAIEKWAATVEITRVNPKMSYAKVVKGEVVNIIKGDICRRLINKNDQNKASVYRTSDVEVSGNGGVKLPFD